MKNQTKHQTSLGGIALLAAVVAAAGSGSAAAALPLGSIGLLAPQIGLAASIPALVPFLLGGAVIIGGAALTSKALKSKRKRQRKLNH